MNIRLCERPYRVELSVFRGSNAGGAVVHSSAQEVYHYLKARTGPFSVTDELRQFLAEEGVDSLRPDDDVLREVAAQVMMGRLFLIQTEQTTGDGAVVEAVMDAPARVVELSKPPGRSPPPRRPVAPEAPQPALEQTALIEQDVQAAALELAAVDGTPFCSVCEKLAADRAASVKVAA